LSSQSSFRGGEADGRGRGFLAADGFFSWWHPGMIPPLRQPICRHLAIALQVLRQRWV
jgi:hypothetical protein